MNLREAESQCRARETGHAASPLGEVVEVEHFEASVEVERGPDISSERNLCV